MTATSTNERRTALKVPIDARIGVDIGGTFTDLVLVKSGRVAAVGKSLTTPHDPAIGVVQGLQQLLDRARVDPREVVDVVHGTTLIANSLIERKGARTALLTTRGFRDALAMRREHRYDIYDLSIELPEPLIPRRRRWEVLERVLANGKVARSIEPDEVKALARRARRLGVESIAICFLHSYKNPKHERLAERILVKELPGVPITSSYALMPELGEYVRTSTTAANAYVRPLMNRYLSELATEVKRLGVKSPLRLMLSTGGLASVGVGRRFPILLCESGPAAGAISAAFFGASSGEHDVLAFDMGGTTAKACLVEGGQPLLAREHEVARVHRFAKGSGLPLRTPVIDLIEIGAGGGSIAYVDQFGLPKVGPQSAGAEPGPACYGLGGEQPTVTDADLLLGYLDRNYFLGGELTLDRNAAERALASLRTGLGLDLEAAAAAVHQIVNENMAGAARMHSIERGRDIRNFTLVATGGAGPVHAWGVARRLGLSRILYPPSAGVASAFGMLTAPPAFDFSRSLPSSLAQVRWAEVRRTLESMKRAGRKELGNDVLIELAVDVRHRGQGDALTVELGESLSGHEERQVAEAFDTAYIRLYARKPLGVEAEVLTWRVRVSGPRPSLRHGPTNETGDARKGRRRMWSDERKGYVQATVWDRYRLKEGDRVDGPAVVEERESSAIIGLGGRGRVDRRGNLMVDVP